MKDRPPVMVGFTSRVPGSQELHYLMVDIDHSVNSTEYKRTLERLKMFPFDTLNEVDICIDVGKRGVHLYLNKMVTSDQFQAYAKYLGADQKWIEIGVERGYWFLASYTDFKPPWKMEVMRLVKRTKPPPN